MLELFKEKILRFLRHESYKPLKLSQMAKELGVSDEDYLAFKVAFEELRRAGGVVVGERNLVGLPGLSGKVVGTFRANPKGFGFVLPLEPDAHEDLFIPPNATMDAMTGDTVEAKVVKKGKRAGQMRYSGKVVEIIERGQNRFVGTLLKRDGQWIVQPDGKGFVEPISVDDVRARNARDKDKVVVEIMSFPTERHLARGVIVEVLGRAGQYDAEIASIIRQFHLPDEFNDSCILQAHNAAKDYDPEDLAGRDDITDKTIVTIDPPDSKDFDDAISIEKDKDDNWVLGVHIADVSHFIEKDSPLDAESKERGNSIYLPGKTIPMLPEMLSNGVCSLQPDQRRYTKSAYITYGENGNVIRRDYRNSVICSTQRLTYLQVDRVLKGHTKDLRPEVLKLLRDMETLSKIIEQRRDNAGMLHLDLPETELVFDEAGRVVDAEPADNCYPHTIIEMFMVEANEAVAALIDRLNVPFMRRVHPEPDSMAMQSLAILVKSLGIGLAKTPDRMAIQALLKKVTGTSNSLAISLVVLRSLERAVYAPLHIGHYALASKLYCHFTSPIRRYADLLVHRVLDCYLTGRLGSELMGQVLAAQDLTEIGKHISFTERRSEDAERELKTVLILQMLSDKIGETMDCVVTGLTNFGLFVRSQKFGIEGLVQSADLGPDVWKYHTKSNCVIGTHSGKLICLGLPMKVRIVSINIPARQLNVVPVEPLIDPSDISKSKKSRGRRKGRGRR